MQPELASKHPKTAWQPSTLHAGALQAPLGLLMVPTRMMLAEVAALAILAVRGGHFAPLSCS